MLEDKPTTRRFPRPVGYLVAAVVAAVMSVVIFAGAQYLAAKKVLDNPAAAENAPAPTTPDAGISQLKKTSEGFRNVAKIIGPAVVNIKSTKGAKRPSAKGMRRGGPGGGGPGGGPRPRGEDAPFPGDPFGDFFERFGHPFMQPETPQTSLGSGFIIDKSGIVVTNNHVVEDASEILVSLPGEKTDMKAKLVGTDPKTDLAVLKIETSRSLPVAEWANSDQVEVGDWAVAIGSPFDLRQTVTVGIVSAKGRSSNVLAGAEYVGELLQTDAAINPGNSGGPLCTIEGQVMGVNTAIYTRSGGYMGIGFAIPSNLAKDVVNKLRTDGKIVRGWLGVYIQPLVPELASELKVKDGVGVHEVIEGSPAATAGLSAGDVIIEVEGKPVKEVSELQRVISNFKPNQKVTMKVVSYNDKKTRTVTVKIGEVPGAEAEVKTAQDDGSPDKLGLVVEAAPGKDGVVVSAIEPGSVAQQQLGLEPGDVISRVNRKPVRSVAEYKSLINSSKQLNLEVRQKGRMKFFTLIVPD